MEEVVPEKIKALDLNSIKGSLRIETLK